MQANPRRAAHRAVEILYSAFGLTIPQAPQPALSTGRYGLAADVVGGYILAMGGSSPYSLLNDLEFISLATGVVTTLPTPLLSRRYHTAHVAGGALYVIGGVAPRGTWPHYIPNVEIYDIAAGVVQPANPIPTPRHLAASAYVDGRIYVLGGRQARRQFLPTLEVYDVATDAWAAAAPMPTARECAVVAVGGTIYAVGGYNGGQGLCSFEAYDIAADTWQSLPDLPFPVSAHRMATAGDCLFAFGDYSTLDQVAAYNAATGQWSLLQGTGYLASRHNAVVTANGYVYVLGGNIASSGSALSYVQALSLQALQAAAA